jgi:hypothetical protein
MDHRRANRGHAAEDLLACTHLAYLQAGRALMVPLPTPVGRRRRTSDPAPRGQFTAYYKRKSVSDYLGTLAPDGRALALELKSVEHEERWYPSKLPPHQAAFLDLWAERGGLAYLLIVYVVPGGSLHAAVAKWPALRLELEATQLIGHGLSWETLATGLASSAPVREDSYIVLDYLPAIQALEARLRVPMSAPA